jgi:NAD(P)-dependent dehydrogenase (short-subunit alcohol dehydrogenase family)
MSDSGLFDLTGKVALLTGSTRGMGYAMAEGLAQHGATVIVSSRQQAACDAAAAAINSACGNNRAFGIACHAGHREQLQALVDRTRADHGAPDILVGNAGVNPHYGPMSSLEDDAFDKTMATNVKSNHWLAQMVAPGMIEKGGGSIMITASVGAFRPSTGLGIYGVSKLAVLGLVRVLAAEFGEHGIRANAICPGLIKTDFARALWENPKAAAKVVEGIPLGRLGDAEDLKGMAIFLASPASQYVTGQAMTVCGGSDMWR